VRCAEAGKKFYDYLKGELGPRERAGIKAHLDKCKPCAEEHKKLGKTRSLFVNSLEPAPAKVKKRLDAVFPAERNAFLLPVLKPVFAAAFSLMLLAGGAAFLALNEAKKQNEINEAIYMPFSHVVKNDEPSVFSGPQVNYMTNVDFYNISLIYE